jgi:protein-S-isoprenylcysteine O-methyltransferase
MVDTSADEAAGKGRVARRPSLCEAWAGAFTVKPMPHTPLYLHSPLWTAVFWGSFAAMFLHEMWVFSRDRREAKGERRDRGSLQAIILLQNLGFLACFAIPYLSDRGRIALRPDLLFWSAMAIFWCGLALRNWSVRTLGRFFRTTVVVQDDHQLITTGPYRYLRNPSYTGAMLMFVGIGLAQGDAFSLLAIVAGGLLGYGVRIHAEDAALRSRFGETYEAYRKRSWALIPPVW